MQLDCRRQSFDYPPFCVNGEQHESTGRNGTNIQRKSRRSDLVLLLDWIMRFGCLR
jgi:hypothetical protein